MKENKYLDLDGLEEYNTNIKNYIDNKTYPNATTSSNGLMSSSDKAKLDGIAVNANKYTHPTTAGNKHIPAGGSNEQILKWSAAGTAQWADENDTAAKLGTLTIGSTTQPIYLKEGVPEVSNADIGDSSNPIYMKNGVLTKCNPHFIEFKGVSESANNGGYIDFHYNGSTKDYTSRIIESLSGTINIDGNLQIEKSLTANNITATGDNICIPQGSNAHYALGTNHAAGYVQIAQIRLSRTADTIIVLDIIRRLTSVPTVLTISFTHNTTDNTLLKSFTYYGTNCDACIKKSSTEIINGVEKDVWDLYIKKSNAYDVITVTRLQRMNRLATSLEIVWTNVHFNEKPDDVTTASLLFTASGLEGNCTVSGNLTFDSLYEERIIDNLYELCVTQISGNSKNSAFPLSITSPMYCEQDIYTNGKFLSSGADFAEYFEWLDGNINNEDRTGKFVTLDGEKIKLANADDYILGVVSAVPTVIGDSQAGHWKNKYLKDVYGRKITETVEIEEYINENDEVVPTHTETRFILNTEYNPEKEYVNRSERPEWTTVGLIGKLIVEDDGTCMVNEYCKPKENGIASKSDKGYRVIKRIDKNHIKVLIK